MYLFVLCQKQRFKYDKTQQEHIFTIKTATLAHFLILDFSPALDVTFMIIERFRPTFGIVIKTHPILATLMRIEIWC